MTSYRPLSTKNRRFHSETSGDPIETKDADELPSARTSTHAVRERSPAVQHRSSIVQFFCPDVTKSRCSSRTRTYLLRAFAPMAAIRHTVLPPLWFVPSVHSADRRGCHPVPSKLTPDGNEIPSLQRQPHDFARPFIHFSALNPPRSHPPRESVPNLTSHQYTAPRPVCQYGVWGESLLRYNLSCF